MKRVVATIFLLGLTACTGARTQVVAPGSEYPVSLSRGLRDADGNLVPAERKKVVGTFKHERTAWNILWAAVRITPETDISGAVNQQIAAAKGDAIIHLTIVTRQCPLNYLSFPFGILPFWPSCANIEMTGDIVKVEAAAPPPPPRPDEAYKKKKKGAR
jgi:hypothetical protein